MDHECSSTPMTIVVGVSEVRACRPWAMGVDHCCIGIRIEFIHLINTNTNTLHRQGLSPLSYVGRATGGAPAWGVLAVEVLLLTLTVA